MHYLPQRLRRQRTERNQLQRRISSAIAVALLRQQTDAVRWLQSLSDRLDSPYTTLIAIADELERGSK